MGQITTASNYTLPNGFSVEHPLFSHGISNFDEGFKFNCEICSCLVSYADKSRLGWYTVVYIGQEGAGHQFMSRCAVCSLECVNMAIFQKMNDL
jgi:hypothetical protein